MFPTACPHSCGHSTSQETHLKAFLALLAVMPQSFQMYTDLLVKRTVLALPSLKTAKKLSVHDCYRTMLLGIVPVKICTAKLFGLERNNIMDLRT